MDPAWEDPIEDDDDNAYDEDFSQERDAIIFLIDATQDMFQVAKDETPFALSLKCARTSLFNKIISNNKDLQAIVLFGTGKCKSAHESPNFKYIYVFHELGEPGAEKILEIEELMTMDQPTFRNKYGHNTNFSLAEALSTCHFIIANCRTTLAHKKVLIFTSTDHPHEKNHIDQVFAKMRAKDLFRSGTDIDLLHMQRANAIFDVSKFYKDIIQLPDDEKCKLPTPSEKYEELIARVRSKDHKQRPIANTFFTLDIEKDIKFAVSIYQLVVPAPKPAAAKLWRENNAELTSMTKTFLGDTGEVLLSSDLMRYQEYGNQQIYFDEDEVKQMKNLDEPGLLLMGFKPQKFLKINHHIRVSLFAYPDEGACEGSTRIFYALLLQCKEREYMPICRLILRKNDPPRFVALLPQEEQVDDHGTQTIRPGFHIVYLPFMEDIRNIAAEKKHCPSESSVEKAKEIIKKLKFGYRPEFSENPVLQKHWRSVEALALKREAPKEIVDYTLRPNDDIEETAGKHIDEFKALFLPGVDHGDKGQMGYGPQAKGPKLDDAIIPTTFQQEASTGQGYGPQDKKPKLNEAVIPATLQQEASTGQLGRFKVKILKEFCFQNGIRAGTKKAELIEAITEFYAS